jgi:hypothetical protein
MNIQIAIIKMYNQWNTSIIYKWSFIRVEVNIEKQIYFPQNEITPTQRIE